MKEKIMGNNNTKINSRANAVATAWANLAKDDSFAGLTLQQFTQMVDAVDGHQTDMNNLLAQYTGATKERDDLHVALNETTLAVVDAVDGHQTDMNNLLAQYTGATKERDDLHVALNETTLAVVDAVKADLAKHGPDSPLYKTMGYIPKSERASGLSRKATVTVNPGATRS